MPLPLFCPYCGSHVRTIAHSTGRCAGCRREVYANSRPTAGVFLVRGDEVLLVRRGHEPARGKWDLPGGFLEEGETPEDGLRREIREELDIDLESLHFALININPWPAGAVLDIMFEAEAPSREPTPGSDVAGYAWFPIDRLPQELAFEASRVALERWRSSRAPRKYQLLDGSIIGPSSWERHDPVPAEPDAREGLLPEGWRAEGGTWTVRDGQIQGRIDTNAPAFLWYEQPVPGDHLVVFRGSGDTWCAWEGSGSGHGEPRDIACTMASVDTPHAHLASIRRYPETRPRASTCHVDFRGATSRLIAAGRCGAVDFLFVDGKLVLQVDEPGAARRPRSWVALATWGHDARFSTPSVYRRARTPEEP